MEHFIERVQIRRANWNSIEERTRGGKKRANIAELSVKRKTLTQQSGDDGPKRNKKKQNRRKQRRGGQRVSAVFGFTLPPSVFQAKFVINGFHTAVESPATSPRHSSQSAGTIQAQPCFRWGVGRVSAGHDRQQTRC